MQILAITLPQVSNMLYTATIGGMRVPADRTLRALQLAYTVYVVGVLTRCSEAVRARAVDDF
jgi:hypothetical protein